MDLNADRRRKLKEIENVPVIYGLIQNSSCIAIPLFKADTMTTSNHSNVTEDLPDTVKYHLDELEIALNTNHGLHINPVFKEEHKRILDIGCGIGQTFISSNIPAKQKTLLIGIDVDFDSLKYGRKKWPHISFLNSFADRLPLTSECIDIVVSRVCLPYTNIPVAMKEIERVLKPGGELWLTMHPFDIMTPLLTQALRTVNLKGIISRLFFIVNGFVFHFTGRLFSLSGKYESFQTEKAMLRILGRHPFENISIGRDGYFLIKANKKLTPGC